MDIVMASDDPWDVLGDNVFCGRKCDSALLSAGAELAELKEMGCPMTEAISIILYATPFMELACAANEEGDLCFGNGLFHESQQQPNCNQIDELGTCKPLLTLLAECDSLNAVDGFPNFSHLCPNLDWTTTCPDCPTECPLKVYFDDDDDDDNTDDPKDDEACMTQLMMAMVPAMQCMSTGDANDINDPKVVASLCESGCDSIMAETFKKFMKIIEGGCEFDGMDAETLETSVKVANVMCTTSEDGTYCLPMLNETFGHPDPESPNSVADCETLESMGCCRSLIPCVSSFMVQEKLPPFETLCPNLDFQQFCEGAPAECLDGDIFDESIFLSSASGVLVDFVLFLPSIILVHWLR
jgi:hypothetical protein